MNLPSLICFLRAAAAAMICFPSLPLRAEDAPKKVLSTTEVDLGTHKVIYQRVEPPKVADAPVVPAPAAVPSAPSITREEAIANWNRQRSVILNLSCTVYESGVTEVRWWVDGAEYRIVTNVDFNNLRGLGGFTNEESSYMIFMGIGNAMSVGTRLPITAPAVDADVLADLQKSATARYVVVSAPKNADAESYRGIDDLLHHYDAHKDELIAAWQKIEADRIAREQWLKEHPPAPPPDTVIQFWPKKGSRYLNTEKEAR